MCIRDSLVRRDKIGGQISNKPVIASLEFFQHRLDQSGPVYFLSGFQQQGGRLLCELPFKFRKIGVDADTNYLSLIHISLREIFERYQREKESEISQLERKSKENVKKLMKARHHLKLQLSKICRKQ